jgi:hypothetical protein
MTLVIAYIMGTLIFSVSTYFANDRVLDTLKPHWRSGFPACNFTCRNEHVATETVFSYTPSVDRGFTAAKILFADIPLLQKPFVVNGQELVNTIEEVTQKWVAMKKVISILLKPRWAHVCRTSKAR